jgi:hypothetical protein
MLHNRQLVRKTRVRKADFNNTHVDQIVTNQAMEFLQTDDRFIAMTGIPVIKVDQPSGILSILDRNDLNRDEIQMRGRQAQAERAGFNFIDLPYKTDERSLEYDVNAAMVAGASPGRNPKDKIPRALAYKANIHIEGLLTKTIFNATAWAASRVVTGAGADGADSGTAMNRKYFSDPTSDPIAVFRKEIDIFLLRSGMLPTSLRMGRQLFTAIATNPNVRAQVSVMVGGVSQTATFTPPATADQLSALLGLRVLVSSAIRNTAVAGVAATNGFIVPGFDALLSMDDGGAVTDGTMPTSFARLAFTGLAENGIQVRTFERPELGAGGSEASVIDLYQGYLITDVQLGTYFTGMAQ